MFLASRGSLPSSAPVARKPEASIFAPAKVTVPEALPAKQMLFHRPQHVASPPSAISKPITGILQAATLPRSASSSNLDSPVPKSSVPLAAPPVSQAPAAHAATLATTTAAAIMPRGTVVCLLFAYHSWLSSLYSLIWVGTLYWRCYCPLQLSLKLGRRPLPDSWRKERKGRIHILIPSILETVISDSITLVLSATHHLNSLWQICNCLIFHASFAGWQLLRLIHQLRARWRAVTHMAAGAPTTSHHALTLASQATMKSPYV